MSEKIVLQRLFFVLSCMKDGTGNENELYKEIKSCKDDSFDNGFQATIDLIKEGMEQLSGEVK